MSTKCDHLIANLERFSLKDNITEKEFYELGYIAGALYAKYSVIADIKNEDKHSFVSKIADKLGVSVYKNRKKVCLSFPIEEFDYCPYCGAKLDYEAISDKFTKNYLKGKESVNPNVVRERYFKRNCIEFSDEKTSFVLRTPQKEPKIGYVYVVKLDKHYKIGISINPNSRLQEFTLLPYELQTIVLEKVKDYDKCEKELHEHFAAKRVRGEWFELNDLDIEYIKSYLKEQKAVKTAFDKVTPKTED